MLKKIIIGTGFIVLGGYSYSQNSESVRISWEAPLELNDGEETVLVPSMTGQYVIGREPSFFISHPVSSANSSVDVVVSSTESATLEDINYLNKYNIKVGSVRFDGKISTAGRENFLVLNIFPFVIKGQEIVRISGFTINYSKEKPNLNHVSKDFVTSSVLRSGTGSWYKISVVADGIYKIDKAMLVSMGIDVENINPQNINIFGNGDGILPENNATPRTDDLAKNAIKIVGESDGAFDDGDYILFYGWGPNRWYAEDTTRFNQKRHIYSDVSCYFININPSDTPLRIENVFETPTAATNFVSDYSFYNVHELDYISLVHGGQRWYGELFDTDLNQTFGFNVPDIVSSSPVLFEVSLGSNANVSAGTLQTYNIGGAQLFQSNLPTSSDFGRSTHLMSLSNPPSSLPLQISITRNSPDVLTYLDRILLNAKRQLNFVGTQLNFADLKSFGVGKISEFTVSNLPVSNGFVWEVTDRHQPYSVSGNFVGSNYVFRLETDSLRQFVASNGISFYTPVFVGEVIPQNLHELTQADYLIVTHANFLSQANRLANLHIANGLTVHVLTTTQIFNEFSSGMQDATAIRSFVKMFYDRSLSLGTPPKYLLLFGDGTYDPKNRVANNNNFILTYQINNSNTSEDHIGNMPSDDYFGILGDNEQMNPSDMVDVAVGRLLISDLQMAKEQVDKIEHYMHNGSNLYSTENTNCSSNGGSTTFGDWRTKYVLIADDEENGYFINSDVEPMYNYISDSLPEMNCEKIYLDAYTQSSTAGGERYPDVNNAIDSKIERGALVVSYVGHGGEVGVAEERVITVPQIKDWRNIDVLPLVVSATCEFTKFDDPERVSAGEWASINPYGAAIALMTTTRSVYFQVNTDIGNKFIRNVFKRNLSLEPSTFGEIIRATKNQASTSLNNKRSFTLIGDPALKIALPQMQIVTDSINGVASSLYNDTIQALSKVIIKGHVKDNSGSLMSSFNGVLYPSVFDKPKSRITLGNDASSPEIQFYTQNNKVYNGKSSINNGYFEFTFIVPKDIDYSIDYGKISYYAENGTIDAFGYDTSFYIGGLDPNGINDSDGPTIELYINDESFVDGGITDETPILIAQLFDVSGINTVGNGIGHDLIAVLDGETGDPIVLNDFYTANLDSYQSGEVRYNFTALEPGIHKLTIKGWDVNNNSSEASIDFVVQEQTAMALDHVLNYPNPFTTSTDFYFEHNQVCSQLESQIQIFTVSGRLVKTINETVMTEGFRSEGIHWNGRDDFGDQLAKGVYVYRVNVKTPDGLQAEKTEKLVILN